MNNQKKIEEILYSIQELILEAQNEKKLDLVETKRVIEPDKINSSKTNNLENNQDYTESYVNKLIKTKEFKNTKLEGKLTKNNYNLKSSWKDLNFKKCQEKASNSSTIETNKNNFENDLEIMFKDSLSFWIKKNLPDLIKDETALHTKKIFEDKLK
ncbi:hypothetical protein OAY92_03695 [Alphaproteobacteria bacterium]|nr:hypothetical protein [Alphaproteobacteria bacterium]